AGEGKVLYGACATRQHGGDTGADRPLADPELAAARDQGRMAPQAAGDVGDRIQRTRGAVERHTQIAGARPRFCRVRAAAGGARDRREQHEGEQGDPPHARAAIASRRTWAYHQYTGTPTAHSASAHHSDLPPIPME